MQKNGSTIHKDAQGEGRPKPEDTRSASEHANDPESSASGDRRTGYPRSARRPAADRPAAFDLSAWLVEGATGLMEELRHNDLGLPEEFWVHLYAARRESLLAARALIDSLLAKLEQEAQKAVEQRPFARKTDKESEQRRARRGGVKIDF